MFTMLRTLARDKRAATAIEYGLIVALIVIVMVVGFTHLAKGTVDMWNTVSTKVLSAG